MLSATDAVVLLQGTHPALASTTDGGARWTVRATPAGPEDMCRGDGDNILFAAASPDDWWLLCTGGAAAGSSTKALMRSVDVGQTWTVAASTPSLTEPVLPGSLPRQDAAAIAAGSPEVLWIATPNTVWDSTDGGVTWRQALFGEQGAFGKFDVQSGTLAWLLAPNAGLWHTTDGTTWRQIASTAP
ncbi:MAG: WD40/YVTN/BNR-like repeat-containing protein [Streptosporangiaceae bacterium]